MAYLQTRCIRGLVFGLELSAGPTLKTATPDRVALLRIWGLGMRYQGQAATKSCCSRGAGCLSPQSGSGSGLRKALLYGLGHRQGFKFRV